MWWALVQLQAKTEVSDTSEQNLTHIISSFDLLGLTFNNLDPWFDYFSYSSDPRSTFENKETWEQWMNKPLGESQINHEPNQWVIVNNESLNLTLAVLLKGSKTDSFF